MAEIFSLAQIDNVLKTKKSIVLAGGCFDILHIGHIKFLKEAKKMGDILVVLVESDEKVKKLKGRNRPIFNQKERSEMISSLSAVDYVVNLPYLKSNREYFDLVSKINPEIIAVTQNDPQEKRKREQAEKVGGKLVAIPFFKTYSSSKLAKIIGIE